MRKLLVVLSGGQDSTTCAAWARQNASEVHAITFNYGQRHGGEIEAAKKVAELLSLASHEVIELGPVLKGNSPLVNTEEQVAHYSDPSVMPEGVEPTFVPGRNLLFLAIAANRASILGAGGIVIGVCQADYGGYHDCRQSFVDRAAQAIGEAINGDPASIPIITPLMNLSKADSVRMASGIPGAMEALAYTLTSYDGDYPPTPFNHSSLLRAKGFHDAGVSDPLIVRAKKEGLLPADYPDTGYVPETKYGDEKNFGSLLEGVKDSALRQRYIPPAKEQAAPTPKKKADKNPDPDMTE